MCELSSSQLSPDSCTNSSEKWTWVDPEGKCAITVGILYSPSAHRKTKIRHQSLRWRTEVGCVRCLKCCVALFADCRTGWWGPHQRTILTIITVFGKMPGLKQRTTKQIDHPHKFESCCYNTRTRKMYSRPGSHESSITMSGIRYPGEHDVMLGR